MKKFAQTFEREFSIDVLSHLSLPAVAESAMWKLYDCNESRIFSFPQRFSHLNSIIRENILGGPSIVFHRHLETKLSGEYPKSVYYAPGGERIQEINSFDFNALFLGL